MLLLQKKLLPRGQSNETNKITKSRFGGMI